MDGTRLKAYDKYPDSEGPTWSPQDPGGPYVGPWTLLSGHRHGLDSLLPSDALWLHSPHVIQSYDI